MVANAVLAGEGSFPRLVLAVIAAETDGLGRRGASVLLVREDLMTSKTAPTRPLTQLCLQFEGSGDLKAGVSRLSLALRHASFSSLILAAPQGGWASVSLVQPLVELAQAQGIATLIEGDADLARAVRADGVHVPWSEDVAAEFARAREGLGTKFIVGADAGRSRHDAMALAEAGADYIGFGIPAFVEDRVTAAERRLDLTAWWSEIFEIPVMALDVETATDVGLLCAVQADFVAVRLASGATDYDIEVQLLAMSSARVPGPAVSSLAV